MPCRQLDLSAYSEIVRKLQFQAMSSEPIMPPGRDGLWNELSFISM